MQGYYYPDYGYPSPCVVVPPVGMASSAWLPEFHGMDHESPDSHIRAFEAKVDLLGYDPAYLECTRVNLFLSSLKGSARDWFVSRNLYTVLSWLELKEKFSTKFLPSYLKWTLKQQIEKFSAKENESFYVSWERYKNLLCLLPRHGYENFQIVSYFYDGLSQRVHQLLDMKCDGDFLGQTAVDALNCLDLWANIQKS
jgi:hypothetical protein